MVIYSTLGRPFVSLVCFIYFTLVSSLVFEAEEEYSSVFFHNLKTKYFDLILLIYAYKKFHIHKPYSLLNFLIIVNTIIINVINITLKLNN